MEQLLALIMESAQPEKPLRGTVNIFSSLFFGKGRWLTLFLWLFNTLCLETYLDAQTFAPKPAAGSRDE